MHKRTKFHILAKIRQLSKFKALLHKQFLSNFNKIYRLLLSIFFIML